MLTRRMAGEHEADTGEENGAEKREQRSVS